MFTRNWYNGLIVTALNNYTQTAGKRFRALDGGGNLFETYIKQSSNYRVDLPFKWSGNGSWPSEGVAFGDGSVAPTMDDYTLSGARLTTLTVSNSTSEVFGDVETQVSSLYTITNTGSEAITIREIGMFDYVYRADSGACYIMTDRTVLDSPVTIPAGGIGQVTYTIKLSIPE